MLCLTVTHVKIERYFACSKIGQKKVDVEVKIKQKQLSSLVKATYEKNWKKIEKKIEKKNWKKLKKLPSHGGWVG